MVQNLQKSANECSIYNLHGRVVQVTDTLVRATVSQVKIGELCLLKNAGESLFTPAEVIGFDDNAVLLAPVGEMIGVSSRTEVIAMKKSLSVKVGNDLLGCVLDGLGNILDKNGRKKLSLPVEYPVCAPPPNPLMRKAINKPLITGIRAIDGFLTFGEGQRIGILSGAGVGKSTLLSMLTQKADVDVTVIALVGERGREVRQFIDSTLNEETRKKSVVVMATSDRPAIERIKAAHTATSIAEYYRDQGKKVLLVMDSLTRFSRALREVGIAAGETPVRSGFPPSVYAELPKLVERTGQSEKGSITAVYTMLVEGSAATDPIADEVISLLDGHIVLSKDLADSSHFPAIDVLKSLSRVMNLVVTEEHIQLSAKLRKLLAKYEEIEFLIRVGEYKKGTDTESDEALAKYSMINQFLQQSYTVREDFDETMRRINAIAE